MPKILSIECPQCKGNDIIRSVTKKEFFKCIINAKGDFELLPSLTSECDVYYYCRGCGFKPELSGFFFEIDDSEE